MALAALDDRTFESAVEHTPEQAAEIRQHFQDKGYDVEVEGEEPPAAETTTTETQPAEQTTQTETQPAAEEAADGVDAESRAEWKESKNDGEKLGKYAKQTLRRKAVEAELLKEKAVNEELRRQLESRNGHSSQPGEPAAASHSLAPSVVAQPKEETKPEAPKAKEFDKPKPGKPKYEDFLTADDPIAAHAEALSDWTEKTIDWRDEKRDFEARQKAEIETKKIEQDQAKELEGKKKRRSDERFQEARTAHSDFDETTKTAVYNPVLLHLLTDPDYGLEDGMELGYQLAQPEHREFLAELVKNTQTAKGEEQRSVERKLTKATQELAVFRHSLKNKPAEVVKPAATETKPKQTPPKEQPRREEAAPTPVRGRGAPAERLEDIDPMDSDARRDFRKRHGMA